MSTTQLSIITTKLSEVPWNLTLSTAICCLILLLVLNKAFHRLFSHLPPGPLGFPVVGILPFLQKNVEKSFEQWGKKYGPVIYVQLGWDSTVVLNNYEAINQAFVVQSNQFINRPKTFFNNLITSYGHGIAFSEGNNKWKVQRKFAQRSLTKNLEERILAESENLFLALKPHAGKAVDLKLLLGKSVFNVVRSMAIYDQYDSAEMEHFQDGTLNAVKTQGINYILLSLAPWLRFIPPVRSAYKAIIQIRERRSKMFYSIIDAHEASLDSNYPRDYIDMFVIEINKENPMFTKTQLRFALNDLFFAGTETSMTALRWIFRYLVLHPDLQERIHNEIESLVGIDGKIRADLKLPYTRAFIEEAFRVRPAVPMGVFRCTTENVKFMNYVIPPNTQVIANIWAANHDPKVWNDPHTFDPERHLDSDGAFKKSEKMLTFSIGPRNCLGEKMARIEIFIFLVSILQRFKVSLNPDLPLPSMEGQFGLTLNPKEYSLILKEK